MSDSTTYETTYSQDERIADCLKKKREREQDEERNLDRQREEEFRNYYESKKDDEDFVFKLKGIRFLKFTHLKIKFAFEPWQVVTHVSRKVIFYCTLRYRKNHWVMARSSIPVNYRTKVHQFFYGERGFKVDDSNVVPIVVKIYDVLVKWSGKEEEFRLRKFAEYKEGADVYLDSDDEEIFLNRAERRRLHRKRDEVLERMLAPPSERPNHQRATQARPPKRTSASSLPTYDAGRCNLRRRANRRSIVLVLQETGRRRRRRNAGDTTKHVTPRLGPDRRASRRSPKTETDKQKIIIRVR